MIDPIKLLDLQAQGWTSREIAEFYDANPKTVANQARRMGSPFPLGDGRLKTKKCLNHCGAMTVAYQRVCDDCRAQQQREGLIYIETHEVAI